MCIRDRVRYVEMVDTDLARLTGDYAGADEVLRRLERTEDRSRLPWIHFEHGVLYLTWGKLELARHELGLAVQSAGDVGSSESILGAAHANLGSCLLYTSPSP